MIFFLLWKLLKVTSKCFGKMKMNEYSTKLKKFFILINFHVTLSMDELFLFASLLADDIRVCVIR